LIPRRSSPKCGHERCATHRQQQQGQDQTHATAKGVAQREDQRTREAANAREQRVKTADAELIQGNSIYRSPQLTLWTLGPDEWLLSFKLPDYAARKKPQRKPDVIQLSLLDPYEKKPQQISS